MRGGFVEGRCFLLRCVTQTKECWIWSAKVGGKIFVYPLSMLSSISGFVGFPFIMLTSLPRIFELLTALLWNLLLGLCDKPESTNGRFNPFYNCCGVGGFQALVSIL